MSALTNLFGRKRNAAGDGAVSRESGNLRLSWVWSTETHPDANLGDALSALVVSTVSGLAIERASFDSPSERVAAVGTIGHAIRNGRAHLWGTGFDMARDHTGTLNGYDLPEHTELVVHAVRGKETADALRKRGMIIPEVYGDPVWFLPKIFPKLTEPKHDLGIIVHISELEAPFAYAAVKATIDRYNIPDELKGSVKIINTYAPATIDGLQSKTEEILSCRRILSTSLHGLVIAEAYGIPCAWFATYAAESGQFKIGGDKPIDHRMRDFYTGVDREHVLTYAQPSNQPTDWQNAIKFIDLHWQPLNYTGENLLSSFPLRPKVKLAHPIWKIPKSLVDTLPL